MEDQRSIKSRIKVLIQLLFRNIKCLKYLDLGLNPIKIKELKDQNTQFL
jgi:hypothetical protein